MGFWLNAGGFSKPLHNESMEETKYVNIVYFLQVMVDDATILNKSSVLFKTTTVLFDMVGEFYQAALNCGSIYRFQLLMDKLSWRKTSSR